MEGQRLPEKTSSYSWHLEEDRDEIASLQHQLDPFKQELFGFTDDILEKGFFNGTIFRFPFRNQEMVSDLSSTLYDQNKIKSLVTSMAADAHHILLFLKNLESIEFYEKRSGVTEKLLDIRIAQPYLANVVQQRQSFLEDMKSHLEIWMKQDSISVVYPISIEVTILDNIENKSTTRWFISHYFAGQGEAKFNKCSSNTRYLPAVGVALQIPPSAGEHLNTEPKGHIFCFLPLPLEKKSPTGLHFHVHGCFAVDQNRRHIKWPSADQKQLTDTALLWNQFLVNAVLPKAVLRLTVYLVNNISDGMPSFVVDLKDFLTTSNTKNPEYLPQLVYSLLPNKETVTFQWQGMIERFYENIWNQKICYTQVLGGKWLDYADCIFDDDGNTNSTNLIIRNIMLFNKQNLSILPTHLFKRLPVQSKKITAEMVCESLKKVQNEMELRDSDKIDLLQYLLINLKNPAKLLGLRLLFLADGSWTEFNPSTSEQKVYVDSIDHPRRLLPGLEHLFLNAEALPQCCRDLASSGQ